ncbi:MAG: transglutaminase [Deltaproteobacteria bacterium HGW-Deltaproteobacteria-15]|nr:MAG: transglutaminase [Deltaproteobacteria bacterium HGW-Deltaproteobacteria-15]
MWGCILSLMIVLSLFSVSEAGERRAEVIFKIDLKAPEGAENTRLWIPYPMTDEHQVVERERIEGNYTAHGVYREQAFGRAILYAEWKGPAKNRTLTYTFSVSRWEVIKKDFPKEESSFNPKGFEKYLLPTTFGPTSGKVKETAQRIAGDKPTILAKAKAIYDWIVDNMYRDPKVEGCGIGDVERLLVSLGGKCVDIHSVFVALARSVGVPSREIYGIRIPGGKIGDMTSAQHCWAEFYLPGYGWVPVDPADVRKIMLERQLSPGEEKEYREYYFGAVDENRIAFGTGKDILLNPPQSGGRLPYFGYPYAESDGKPLDDLFGFNLGYTISFKEP